MIRAATIITLLLAASGAAAIAQEARPIQRKAITYPPLAAQYGVAGTCAMTFDVNAGGTPENICGVCNTNAPARGEIAQAIANIFVTHSKAIVAKWRYTTGTPTKDVHTTLTYTMGDDGSSSEDVSKPAAPVCDIGEIS